MRILKWPLNQYWPFPAQNASPNGVRKHNCDGEYENGDKKPEPSPDMLLNRDSHRFTLTVWKTDVDGAKRVDSDGAVLWNRQRGG
jgi:hypothetical protein